MNAGPGDIAQWLQQARVFQRVGKWNEATDVNRRILAADPQDPDALHSFGVLHAHDGSLRHASAHEIARGGILDHVASDLAQRAAGKFYGR